MPDQPEPTETSVTLATEEQLRAWLRHDQSDRRLYERTKRYLARREWKYTQHYADARTVVVQEIMARARAAHDRGDST